MSCGDTYTYHSCLFISILYHHYRRSTINFSPRQLFGNSGNHSTAYFHTDSLNRSRHTQHCLPPRGDSLELPTALLTLNITCTWWQWRRTLRIHGVSPNALVIRVMSRILQKVSSSSLCHLHPLEGVHLLISYSGYHFNSRVWSYGWLPCDWWQGRTSCIVRAEWAGESHAKNTLILLALRWHQQKRGCEYKFYTEVSVYQWDQVTCWF